MIFNPQTMPYTGMLQSIETAAPLFNVAITTRGVADAAELESAIAAAGRETGTALIVLPDIFNTAHHEQIIALAAQHNAPAIYAFRYFAAGGGLMSYGTNAAEEFRRAASYVDRILKGAKPGDLPVQAPNKFEFVINLKTRTMVRSPAAPSPFPFSGLLFGDSGRSMEFGRSVRPMMSASPGGSDGGAGDGADRAQRATGSSTTIGKSRSTNSGKALTKRGFRSGVLATSTP